MVKNVKGRPEASEKEASEKLQVRFVRIDNKRYNRDRVGTTPEAHAEAGITELRTSAASPPVLRHDAHPFTHPVRSCHVQITDNRLGRDSYAYPRT